MNETLFTKLVPIMVISDYYVNKVFAMQTVLWIALFHGKQNIARKFSGIASIPNKKTFKIPKGLF